MDSTWEKIEITQEEKDLWEHSKVHAIKAVRERTGLGLVAAKSLLEGNPIQEVSPSPQLDSLTEEEATQREKDLWESGKKIQAVKSVRERTGLDILAAKTLFKGIPIQEVSPSPQPDSLTEEEQTLLASGDYIRVIKSVRERFGCGLKMAKDLIDWAKMRKARVLKSSDQMESSQEGSLTPEEQKLVATGHKISAIRLVQERFGCDLRTAKEYVDKAISKMLYEGASQNQVDKELVKTIESIFRQLEDLHTGGPLAGDFILVAKHALGLCLGILSGKVDKESLLETVGYERITAILTKYRYEPVPVKDQAALYLEARKMVNEALDDYEERLDKQESR